MSWSAVSGLKVRLLFRAQRRGMEIFFCGQP